MGFVGIRKGDISRQIIERCRSAHSLALVANPRTGDDAIITEVYQKNRSEGHMSPLPQASFPDGYLLNFFSSKSLFVGINAEMPYIFHSNYVIGLHKKRLLLFVFLSQFNMQGVYFKWRYQALALAELGARKFKDKMFG
jgi:hypothetical protein